MFRAILADSQADSLCLLCRLIALFCNAILLHELIVEDPFPWFLFPCPLPEHNKMTLTSGPSFSSPPPLESRGKAIGQGASATHLWAQCLALLNKPKAVLNTPKGTCEGQQGPKGCGSQFHSVTPEVQVKRLSKWLGRKLEIKGMRSPQQLSFACEMF